MTEQRPERARSAVVLLSGGLDSATACAWAQHEGYACHALAFDYGQRHDVELQASEAVAMALGCASHRVVRVDLAALGGSALVEPDAAVPTDRHASDMTAGIPPTYVPARNTVFLSIGLAASEALGAQAIVLGINALDYSGYPDCRPEYLAAMQEVARLGTKVGVEGEPIHLLAPLVELSKADIVGMGTQLGVPWALTHSCYAPPEGERATHCGRCDACLLRRRGFEAAGVEDPTSYSA